MTLTARDARTLELSDLRAELYYEGSIEAGDEVRDQMIAHLSAEPSGADIEIERFRAAQSAAVMPMIGPLLDAWECSSQSVREEHPDLDKHLRKINRAMEEAGDEPSGAERAEPTVEKLLEWAVTDGVIRMSKVFDADLQDALVAFARRFASPPPERAEARDAAPAGLSAALLHEIDEVLRFYANVTSYQGERIGGVLQGCPRKPAPTPDDLAVYARRLHERFLPAAHAALGVSASAPEGEAG